MDNNYGTGIEGSDLQFLSHDDDDIPLPDDNNQGSKTQSGGSPFSYENDDPNSVVMREQLRPLLAGAVPDGDNGAPPTYEDALSLPVIYANRPIPTHTTTTGPSDEEEQETLFTHSPSPRAPLAEVDDMSDILNASRSTIRSDFGHAEPYRRQPRVNSDIPDRRIPTAIDRLDVARPSNTDQRQDSYRVALTSPFDRSSTNLRQDSFREAMTPQQPREMIELHDIEFAASPPPERDDGDGKIGKFCRSCSSKLKKSPIYIPVIVIAVIAGLLFVSLFPPSFVYVDYQNVALQRSRITGYIDKDDVVYPGCYVLGPDTELVYFPATGQLVHLHNVEVFLNDKLTVSFSLDFMYFLRQQHVGKLYKTFAFDYDKVFRKIVTDAVKNIAVKFSLDDIRFRRPMFEKSLHLEAQRRLGGNCCPDCCQDTCQTNRLCQNCVKFSFCKQGYYTDILYFYLHGVSLPPELNERILNQTLIQVAAETEVFLQQTSLTRKETERMVQEIKNEANEINANAKVTGEVIVKKATYESSMITNLQELNSLNSMCGNLSITKQDHKLSLYYIKSIEKSKNLIFYSGNTARSVYLGE